MAGKPSKPSFLWQAVLILLPVAALAIGSLASLRWDEKSAERDARQNAAANVQSLAQVIRSSAKDEVQRFITLQNMWTMELFSRSQPSVTGTPDPHLAADIAKWEQDYPGFKLADLATRQGELLSDGRQIDPPDTPVAPLPPKWFRELSSEQRELWQAIRRSLADSQDIRPATGAFVDSGVSAEAAQAAANLEQQLKNRSFTYGVPLSASEYSESGISFRGIALAQMLHDPAVALSNSVQQAFWSEIIGEPSFIAPMLLDLAEARTNGADAATCERLRLMRQLWRIQVKEGEWLEPLRHAPELKEKSNPASFWARWTTASAGEALAFGNPMTFQNPGADSDGVSFSRTGHGIWLVPREVIEAIFSKSLAKSRSLVPDFAEVNVVVEGKPLIVSSQAATTNHEVLGTTTGTFGAVGTPDAAKFEIKFLLASRVQMLSAERRRARLFGLLVLGAAAAALIGLVSAWRAFNTQLQFNEAKSNFVSSVSHELRAPIASVRLMAESLERGKVATGEKQNEYYRFIVQECRRLSSLIENVLDFSRIEQGRKQYEFEPTDVAALTRETVKLMEPYAQEKGVQLEFHSTPDTRHSELDIDGRAIQQALVNLIDNAIKHSAKGQTVTVGLDAAQRASGVPPDTGVNTATNGAMPVLLYVEDQGAGIPPAEHEKIFERFYRLGSELRRETQGVGIGLSIVRHIIAAHGGNVTVRSNPGQGSRFTIVLPVQIKPQMNADERR
jgi:signal transduction histidine kinase